MATTQALFKKAERNGEPLDISKELTINDLIRFEVPSGGPYITGAPQSNTLEEGQDVLLSPLATIAANTLTDPLTVAEVLLFKEVSESGLPDIVTGPAVEHTVFTRNRDQTFNFGELQLNVPTSGGSSLRMRMGSGSMSITNFSTFWSNQQGGASEQTPNFTLSTSWRHFRSSLNLTQHNNYQEGRFEANGWLYRVQVIVGLSWQNNKFTCTRWRLDGVKGDTGTPGTNGTDGVDGKGIVTSHRSDGVAAIGGTIYTLDHIIYEYTDGSFQDMGFLTAPAPAGLTAVELASYAGGFTTGRTLTLSGGRTWQNVLDEFTLVYVNVGGNNLFSHDQSSTWSVLDLATQNTDMAVTDYQTHGSNSYHWRLRVPASNSTTVLTDNDGSTMQAQRIRIVGIK